MLLSAHIDEIFLVQIGMGGKSEPTNFINNTNDTLQGVVYKQMTSWESLF